MEDNGAVVRTGGSRGDNLAAEKPERRNEY